MEPSSISVIVVFLLGLSYLATVGATSLTVENNPMLARTG